MDSRKFEAVLSGDLPVGRKRELYVQDFLEQNSSLIPTPELLNHHLNFKCVISQFALDKTLVADFAYITKSSILWRVVLVELESPTKKIFLDQKDQIGFRSEFNDALAQIRSWKVFIDKNRDAVMRKLDPLWRPAHMRDNRVEFTYVLVYGRSSEYQDRKLRSQTLAQLAQDESIRFFSYDSLVRSVENGWDFKKNVVRMNKGVLSFKHLHCEPSHLFAYVTSDELDLSATDKSELEGWGYNIEAWEKGQPLAHNGKQPVGSSNEAADALVRLVNRTDQDDE